MKLDTTTVAALALALGARKRLPAHEWDGTKLRVQKHDGSWGDWVDLAGRPLESKTDAQAGVTDERIAAAVNAWADAHREALRGTAGENAVLDPDTLLRDIKSAVNVWLELNRDKLRGAPGKDAAALSTEEIQGAVAAVAESWLLDHQEELKGEPGKKGDPGTDGKRGLPPAHRWIGKKVQFQNPDGTWGELVDLAPKNTGSGGGGTVSGMVAPGKPGPPGPPGPPGSHYSVEFRVLTGAEIAAKQLTLEATPSDPTRVEVDVIHGIGQRAGVDFFVTGNVLVWSGLALEDLLEVGSDLTIRYNLD